jgi:hypothetical protein
MIPGFENDTPSSKRQETENNDQYNIAMVVCAEYSVGKQVDVTTTEVIMIVGNVPKTITGQLGPRTIVGFLRPLESTYSYRMTKFPTRLKHGHISGRLYLESPVAKLL